MAAVIGDGGSMGSKEQLAIRNLDGVGHSNCVSVSNLCFPQHCPSCNLRTIDFCDHSLFNHVELD